MIDASPNRNRRTVPRLRLIVPSILVCLLLFHGGTPSAHAQERGDAVPRVSPNAIVSQTIGVTDVEISYGRPSVRDREVFGGLVPLGEVWRTGANEATTISFSTPVEIEGESLEAGTYGLFTIPGENRWTFIFNEDADQWGAYNYDSSKDILRVEVDAETADSREMMTFSFHNVTDTSATCVLRWSETRVPFDITVNTPDVVHSRAEEAVAQTDDWQEPLRYVSYALENNVLLPEALDWVNRSIELEEHFANLRMKAHVLAATDQYEQAVETATAALSKADSMEESPNGVDELRDELESWKAEL